MSTLSSHIRGMKSSYAQTLLYEQFTTTVVEDNQETADDCYTYSLYFRTSPFSITFFLSISAFGNPLDNIRSLQP